MGLDHIGTISQGILLTHATLFAPLVIKRTENVGLLVNVT